MSSSDSDYDTPIPRRRLEQFDITIRTIAYHTPRAPSTVSPQPREAKRAGRSAIAEAPRDLQSVQEEGELWRWALELMQSKDEVETRLSQENQELTDSKAGIEADLDAKARELTEYKH